MRKLTIICIVLCSFISRAQADTLPPKFEIVGDYYANNYSVFYPIGWSKTGNLAYIIQDVNSLGGAQIYVYDLAITSGNGWENLFQQSTIYNLETDTSYSNFHQEFSDYYDTTHFNYTFMTDVYWKNAQKSITSHLTKHAIIKSDSRMVEPLDKLSDHGIFLTINKTTDTINTIRVDQKYEILVNSSGKSESIYSKFNRIDENGMAFDKWGNLSDLLYYQIEGFIKSPYSNHYYLYIHEITFGFEEPAENVILVPFSIED